MGGKGGGTTNTVSEPWSGQQPYLTNVFTQAQKLYDNGSLAPKYYSGNTVADQSKYTTGAYNIVNGQASKGDNSYSSMSNAMKTTNGVMNNAISGNTGLSSLNAVGDTNAENTGLSYLQGYSSSNPLKGNTGYNTAVTMSGTDPSNSAANKYLSSYNGALNGNTGYNSLISASGEDYNNNLGQNALAAMTSAVNPYSQTLLDQAIGQQTNQLNGNFSSAGRYGSGAHENAVADAATNLTNQFYLNVYDQQMQAAQNYAQNYSANADRNINAATQASNAYNNNQQNILNARQNAAQNSISGYNSRLNAANQASDTYMTNQGNLLSAAQQASQGYNTGIGNNIAAMNDAASAYNTGLGQQNTASQNAQNLYNQRYTDAQWLSDIGANQENYNQALVDAKVDRYNYNAQRPLTALSNLNQLIQGTYGGTSTSTGKSNYSGSALGSAVGGATTAASLLSMLNDSGLTS